MSAAKEPEAKTTGALGWPLVPSKIYPGETTLACPKCGSTNITLSGVAPFRGTGPGGRRRMGDQGWRDVNRCNACKHETSAP